MKKLILGILAHVDAGKTTLSEGLLYLSGAVRRLGRVDHRDAFLDTDAQERERGITIFAMERALAVLDCAVLVVSGPDGIQGHTRTLWRLLARHAIPTFLFINKMDLAGSDREAILAQLQTRFDSGCLDFSGGLEPLQEDLASCDEELMDRYLEGGAVEAADASALIDASSITLSDMGTMDRGGGSADRASPPGDSPGEREAQASAGPPGLSDQEHTAIPATEAQTAEILRQGPPEGPGANGFPGGAFLSESPTAISGSDLFLTAVSLTILLTGILTAFLFRRRKG